MTTDAEKLKECFAAIEKGDTEYIAKFIKNGNIDDQSSPLLHTAARYGKSEIVELLLGKGAQVDFKQEDDETALMAASKKGHEEVVELLLQGGANPNSQCCYGKTALMFAAQKGHSGVARMLLKCGAKVDVQEIEGWSALMFSIKKGHTATIEVLLDSGADADLQCRVTWESPMSLAVQQEDPSIANLINMNEMIMKLEARGERHNDNECVELQRTAARLRRRNGFIGALTALFGCILNLFRREPTVTSPVTTEGSEPMQTATNALRSTASTVKGSETWNVTTGARMKQGEESGVPLCMGTLTLLKWRDSEGKLQRFYLPNKVSSRWMMLGFRFGREPDELEALEDEYSKNAKRCWYKVMELWLGEGGTSEYPTTWEGLVVALEDVEYSSVARELERALDSVIHPSIPSNVEVY